MRKTEGIKPNKEEVIKKENNINKAIPNFLFIGFLPLNFGKGVYLSDNSAVFNNKFKARPDGKNKTAKANIQNPIAAQINIKIFTSHTNTKIKAPIIPPNIGTSKL